MSQTKPPLITKIRKSAHSLKNAQKIKGFLKLLLSKKIEMVPEIKGNIKREKKSNGQA